MYGKSTISNSLPAAIAHRGRLRRAGRNRETSAIFVKEARAREHIYITRGGAIRMRRRRRRCGLRLLARPVGSRWFSPTTLVNPSIPLPPSSHPTSLGSSGVCERNPSRLLGVRARARAPARPSSSIRRHVRAANELHIHLAGSTSKAANLIPRWSLVRM